MNTISMNVTEYLKGLSVNLRYVALNRRTLVASGLAGDALAGEIMSLYFSISAGAYEKRNIERFNSLCDTHRELSHA